MFEGDDKLQLDGLGEESLSADMKSESQLTALGPPAPFSDPVGKLPTTLVMESTDIKSDPSGDPPPANPGMQLLPAQHSHLNQLYWFGCQHIRV